MQIDDLLAWHTLYGFNDIELWPEPKDVEPGFTPKQVTGLRAFANHGSGSLYALYQDHVVWLDSEGTQFTIAKNVDEFVDALHLYAGALYDALSGTQGRVSRSVEDLKATFDQAWVEESIEDMREEFDNYPEFEERAKAAGRAAPQDLVERLIALRDFNERLRSACGSE